MLKLDVKLSDLLKDGDLQIILFAVSALFLLVNYLGWLPAQMPLWAAPVAAVGLILFGCCVAAQVLVICLSRKR